MKHKPVKIIAAMDSFKGSLSAEEACLAVKQGILSVKPEIEIIIKPVADGGEGTARTMIAARNGQWISKRVTGPLPDMKVDAGFAWFEKDRDALVEMAAASGLPLLEPDKRNPLNATTFGTGELIKTASERNPKRLLLAVGGSATVDGGVGAAMALGWRFMDKKGNNIGFGGGRLSRINQIVPPENMSLSAVEVLCDVDNPLCGPSGAAMVFGPQKGATPEMVEQLEAGLSNLAEVVRKQLGKDINVSKAGAAGGLAAGAMAFMNARLVSGIETIIACTNLGKELSTADWVITGEGCFDSQSLHGKVVSGIVKAARTTNIRIAVLAGSVTLSQKKCEDCGITDAIAAKKENMSLDYAIAHSKELLAGAAAEFAKKHLSGS